MLHDSERCSDTPRSARGLPNTLTGADFFFLFLLPSFSFLFFLRSTLGAQAYSADFLFLLNIVHSLCLETSLDYRVMRCSRFIVLVTGVHVTFTDFARTECVCLLSVCLLCVQPNWKLCVQASLQVLTST